MGIDRAREIEDGRRIDAYWADGKEQPLSEFIGGMKAKEFEQDCSDIFIGYMDMSMERLQEALADAQDELENWPGEYTQAFKVRAAQIVMEMLSSARTYKEMVG